MADKKFYKITAGAEFEKDFYVEAENKEQALRELEEHNFTKEVTIPLTGKIDVDVVNKETEVAAPGTTHRRRTEHAGYPNRGCPTPPLAVFNRQHMAGDFHTVDLDDTID